MRLGDLLRVPDRTHHCYLQIIPSRCASLVKHTQMLRLLLSLKRRRKRMLRAV